MIFLINVVLLPLCLLNLCYFTDCIFSTVHVPVLYDCLWHLGDAGGSVLPGVPSLGPTGAQGPT